MTDSEQIVYISCVEEVRLSFVSHLSEALYEKGISDVFVDSEADLLSEEAIEKVERARVAVMILPGNRTVCLNKLLKVLGYQRDKDQVVPVLYGDTPLQGEWHSALHSEGLSSIHLSSKECSDSKLVDEIVKDVYEKLFYLERIGIYSKLQEIESMVCKQPFGVRCVGIWGMPGIGKTTLAKAVFNQISGDFDVYCFIEDHDRAIHEKGLYRLLEEQFSKEKDGAGGSITKLSLLTNKLNNQRALVVLDDVHNHLIVEPLLGGFDWFGPESLIIITSRYKQVFRLCRVNQIYEVQGLNEKEALQLFLLSASIKDKEEQNLHHERSMKVIEYANGNPLALSIYGRELKGMKNPSDMETAFLKLKRHPPSKIVEAFKSSYDTLDDSEKNIFLDIACFFNGENVDYVMQLLEGCGFFPHVGIDVLVGKSLVTASKNCVWMHNLVQDFGRAIINGETVHIERRSRLWEASSIKDLLVDDERKANVEPKTTIKRAQGRKEIEGIFLDTSTLRSFDMKPAAFDNMSNLRLLKIYCSNPEIHSVISFHNGSLHSLPNELRLLHWENYSAKVLPQKFDPRNLVEINMPYSQLETLWSGTKNLEMLRTIRLRHSQKLVDVDVLLKAKKLEAIDLQGCTKLQSFPATGKLLHLRDVNLSGCTVMRNFPEIPPNIETLHLQGTGIRKLPIVKPDGGKLPSLSEFKGLSDALKLELLTSLEKSSLSNQDLGKLICLELKDCSCLRSLPNMVNIEFLKVLDLSGCSELKTIQGFPQNLKELYIAGTAVRKVPQLPQSLELFNAHGCLSLKSIRLDSKKLPMHYTFSNCFNLSPSMVSKFLVEALANAKHIPRERQQELNRALAFSFCSPSPADQNSTLGLQPGYSVMTRLNPSWRNTIVGFAMLVEVAFSEDYCDATGFGIRCVCRWKNKKGHSQRIERNLQCWAPGKAVPKVRKDLIFVFVDVNMRLSTDEGNDPNILADLVVFEFFPVDKQNDRREDSCAVKRCGLRVINAAAGNTSLEDIPPVLSLDGNEVEEVLTASYDDLKVTDKALFLYVACLFNDGDAGLVTSLIDSTELDVGLKVLADRSLISVSSNGEIVMHNLQRRISLKKIEILVENYMINARKVDITHTENPENWTRYSFDMSTTDNEAYMIEEVTRDVSSVSNKLNATPSRDFDGMVGLEAHLRELESLLDLDNYGVKVVGITGPAGIGKSTIARALESRLFKLIDEKEKKRFQLTCFMDNHNLMGSYLPGLEERNKKVLIILDDVNNMNQLTALAKKISWFGPGSRIVVTTENKDLLQQHGIKHTYHVGFPSEKEALEILCGYAFKQNSPPHGFKELAERITELCGRLPLGLRVMGSSLRNNMDKAKWENVQKGLEINRDFFLNIQKVIRLEGIPKCLPRNFRPEYLVALIMQNSKLEKLWDGVQELPRLIRMDLSGSLHLKELPDLSNATNLELLYLDDCKSLVELPGSYSNLQNLSRLWMNGCRKLEVIPTNCNLESLEFVLMAGCSQLANFPCISQSITLLVISYTAVEEVPTSVTLWSHLECLVISGNQKLKKLPQLPMNITRLNLSNNGFESISDCCIKDLQMLSYFTISGCRKLTSLPELPPSLEHLDASNCESLETVSFPSDLSDYQIFNDTDREINFANCFKLNKEARRAIIEDSFYYGVAILPGTEVPAEFNHRAMGNTMSFTLPAFSTFKVCLVISPNELTTEDVFTEILCRRIRKGYEYPVEKVSCQISTCQTKHLCVFHYKWLNKYMWKVSREIMLEFSSRDQNFDILECGAQISLTYESDDSVLSAFDTEDDEEDYKSESGEAHKDEDEGIAVGDYESVSRKTSDSANPKSMYLKKN